MVGRWNLWEKFAQFLLDNFLPGRFFSETTNKKVIAGNQVKI